MFFLYGNPGEPWASLYGNFMSTALQLWIQIIMLTTPCQPQIAAADALACSWCQCGYAPAVTYIGPLPDTSSTSDMANSVGGEASQVSVEGKGRVLMGDAGDGDRQSGGRAGRPSWIPCNISSQCMTPEMTFHVPSIAAYETNPPGSPPLGLRWAGDGEENVWVGTRLDKIEGTFTSGFNVFTSMRPHRYEAIFPTRLFCSTSAATWAAATASGPTSNGFTSPGHRIPVASEGSEGGPGSTLPSTPMSPPYSPSATSSPSWPPAEEGPPVVPLIPPPAPPPPSNSLGYCSSCLSDCRSDADSAEGSCLESCGLPPVHAFSKARGRWDGRHTGMADKGMKSIQRGQLLRTQTAV